MQHATAGVQHTRLRVAACLDATENQQANVRLPSTAPVQYSVRSGAVTRCGAVQLLGAVQYSMRLLGAVQLLGAVRYSYSVRCSTRCGYSVRWAVDGQSAEGVLAALHGSTRH
jgi:hypothetical protein